MFYEETNDYKEALQNMKECGVQIESSSRDVRMSAMKKIIIFLAVLIIAAVMCVSQRFMSILIPPICCVMSPTLGLMKAGKVGMRLGRRMRTEEYYAGMTEQEVIDKWNEIAHAQDPLLPLEEYFAARKRRK